MYFCWLFPHSLFLKSDPCIVHLPHDQFGFKVKSMYYKKKNCLKSDSIFSNTEFLMVCLAGPQWARTTVFPAGMAPCHCTRTYALHTPGLGQEVRVHWVRPQSGMWHARRLDWLCCHGELEGWELVFAIIVITSWGRFISSSVPSPFSPIANGACKALLFFPLCLFLSVSLFKICFFFIFLF